MTHTFASQHASSVLLIFRHPYRAYAIHHPSIHLRIPTSARLEQNRIKSNNWNRVSHRVVHRNSIFGFIHLPPVIITNARGWRASSLRAHFFPSFFVRSRQRHRPNRVKSVAVCEDAYCNGDIYADRPRFSRLKERRAVSTAAALHVRADFAD